MAILASFILPHPPIIIPEIGKGQEVKIEKTRDTFKYIARVISDLKPDTIIITSPHSEYYLDYFHISPGKNAHGSFSNFGVPLSIKTSYDQELSEAITLYANKLGVPADFKGQKNPHLDHGTMLPLYFINQLYNDYKLVRISLSALPLKDHYDFGKVIKKVTDKFNKKVVFIASGDLSHKLKESGPYGFSKQGPIFDEFVNNAIKDNDLKKLLGLDEYLLEEVAECGLRSFIIMAGAIENQGFKSDLLSYQCPFGVGYTVAKFVPANKVL